MGKKRKVIFLDRDGVINIEQNDYTWQVDKFQFTKSFFDAIKKLSKTGYDFIVITNQGGISKKIYNHFDVNAVHKYMVDRFLDNGIKILEVYYCPHHDEIEQCICRKPDSLMLEKAIARFNVDVSKSYFIGDSPRDMEAAKKVGVTPIKITTNQPLIEILSQINL